MRATNARSSFKDDHINLSRYILKIEGKKVIEIKQIEKSYQNSLFLLLLQIYTYKHVTNGANECIWKEYDDLKFVCV